MERSNWHFFEVERVSLLLLVATFAFASGCVEAEESTDATDVAVVSAQQVLGHPREALWTRDAFRARPRSVATAEGVDGTAVRSRCIPSNPDKRCRRGNRVAIEVSGELQPLFFDFEMMSATPTGYSTWNVRFGTSLSGGLSGTTEDLEYQILGTDFSGAITGVGTFQGELDGHRGGFVFESHGDQYPDGTFRTTFVVLRETAWGELTGLRGSGQVTATREHCSANDTPETCLTLVNYRFRFWLP